MKKWETIAICNSCKAEKIKRKDEYNKDTYLCIECFRKKQGSYLGNKYGKTQKLQGSCKACGVAIASTLKWCKKKQCQSAYLKTKSDTMAGSNNPMWTGKNICKCGKNKSLQAIHCRKCSFEDGKRGGINNGRYISKNRKNFLAIQKSKQVIRQTLTNYLKSNGIRKQDKTEKILQYTFSEFKRHIENLLEDWMTWGNYGLGENKWNIDHVVPISYLVKIGISDPAIVNALCNLRPMHSIENIKKSATLTEESNKVLKELLKYVKDSNKRS